MAVYGKGQMLGSGINPESFKQDYSGFANAAAIQAQGLSNLGQSIGGVIDDYGKMKKQQQEDERSVQKSKSVAKAIGDLIPDLKPTLQNSLLLLDDKEIPLSQRKAEADAISDILTLGIGAISNKQKLDFEKGKLIAENAPDPLSFTPKLLDVGPGLLPVKEGSDGNYYDEDGIYRIRDMKAYIAGEPPEVYSGAGAVPSPAAGINSALKLTGNLKADANAINNAIPLPDNFIYTADGSPGSLPPVGTPIAGADASLLPPKPSDVATPPTAPVLGNNASQAEMPPPQAQPQAPRKLTSRLIQDSKQEEGRVYTIDEVNELASKGIKIKGTPLPNGDFFGTSYETLAPQKGEETIIDPATGTVIRRDIALGGDKTERAAAERKKQQSGFVDEFIKTATETIGMLPNLPDSPVGAKFGSVLGEILPGTETGRVVSRLNTLKANLALDKINQMRAASPTGGAAGNMTVQEWPLFMQEFGSLDAAENKQDLEARLKNASVKLFNRVNGTPEERQAALKNGVITKEQNEIVQKQYEDMLLSLNISMPQSGGASPAGIGVGLSPEAQDILKELNIK